MNRSVHWLWRAWAAVAIPCVYEILIYGGRVPWADAVVPFIYGLLGGTHRYLLDWQQRVAYTVAYHLPAIISAVAIYALLTRWFGPDSTAASETRCRHCNYILRGISEPRCPECGERI